MAWPQAKARCSVQTPPTNTLGGIELKLDDFLRLVLQRNETLEAQMLQTEANRRKARGERGVFEPDLVTSITREANKRTNNIVEEASQGGQELFSERNTIYDTGIESLVPSGGKIRIGYTLSDLVNNVNPIPFLASTNNSFIREYQTFVGATFTQPLLKNAGIGVTTAKIRLAALESDIAFQQYRRQLMLTVSGAEAAYWNLYFAQEQLRFFEESVALAQSILSDSQERLKAGQGTELDVLEAQSGLALRKTKQNEAMQNFFDALSRMHVMAGSVPQPGDPPIRVADHPPAASPALSYKDSYYDAFNLNPDYLIELGKLDQEKVKLGVAKNQLLPDLNLKAAYGFNGLARTPSESWDAAQKGNTPSWSVGVELRMPLAVNIQGRNEYQAARLGLQAALLNVNGLGTQIANALKTSMQKARTWDDSVQSYQTIVRYNEDLLKTERARLSVGKVDARKVLEVEADLFDARQSLADASVQARRAVLEFEIADGSLLKKRSLDLTREQLRRRTMALLDGGHAAQDAFVPLLQTPGH
jgi:outer membrane protein TolC